MRVRTFKYKSPEWFEDVVLTIQVTEHDSGQIAVVINDPKKLIGYIDHRTGDEAED